MTNGRRRRSGQEEEGPTGGTGFTMIELLVVIAISLIIASFAVPAYNRIITHSRMAKELMP